MSYIRRFLTASYHYESTHVRELALLLLDLQIPYIDQWSQKSCKKAAIAILGALTLLKPTNDINKLWTPNMIYYTNYEFIELKKDVINLLKKFNDVIENIEYCVTEKYRSISQHNGFLRNTKLINTDKIRKTIDFL